MKIAPLTYANHATWSDPFFIREAVIKNNYPKIRQIIGHPRSLRL
ncbi:MAG: hypothetical protein KA716_32210 [Gloeotrichia echinulata DEX184]